MSTSLKKCRKCGRVKTTWEFARHLNSKLRPHCLDCWNKYTSDSKKRAFEAKKQARRDKENEYRRANVERIMLKSAKSRAKKRNVPFDIDITDIIIPSTCPVLGIPIIQAHGNNNDNSPSLDRVIPEKGYVKDNVRVISWKANSIKRDSSIEDLKKVIKYIENHTSKTIQQIH